MPAHLKVVRGNPGKRPIVETVQDVTPVSVPSMPTFLKGDAATEWGRIVGVMKAEGRISRADRATLTAYCLSWARMKAMMVGVHSPREKRDEEKHLATLADKLGLSVVSRMRLPAVKKADSDGWSGLID